MLQRTFNLNFIVAYKNGACKTDLYREVSILPKEIVNYKYKSQC